jgi:hypothetical protein
MEIETIGGFRPTGVKKENGAIFAVPSVESVLIQAIGLGTTVAIKSL